MQQTDDNALIPVPIASQAESGNVATIPTAQATAGDGRVSIDLGYPPECAISVAAGGKYPEMKDANGVYNLLSRSIRSIQAWGILPFNAAFATAIGGYPKYSICIDGAGDYWVSTTDANTTVPGASGANWQSLFNGYDTQDQSDTRYLMLASTALQTVTGAVTFSGITRVPTVSAGDNSTNAASTAFVTMAVTSEATARATADALKANLAGGNTFTGTQTVNDGNISTSALNGTNATGQLLWGAGVGGVITGRGTAEDNGPVGTYLYPIEVVGSYSGARLQVNGYGKRADADFRINGDGSPVAYFGGNQIAYVSDVNNAVSGKVNRSGDIMTGALASSAWISGGYNGGMNGTASAGSYMYTKGVGFGDPYGNGSFKGTWSISDIYGNGSDDRSGINLTGNDASGAAHVWYFAWNGNITTSKGNVAFVYDVTAEATTRANADNSLQNQINGKQPVGDYITSATYINDFSTSDNRVINLAYGHRIQVFQITLGSEGTTFTLPVAFSGTMTGLQILPGSSGGIDPFSDPTTWTDSSFVAHGYGAKGGNGPASVIAIGPK